MAQNRERLGDEVKRRESGRYMEDDGRFAYGLVEWREENRRSLDMQAASAY